MPAIPLMLLTYWKPLVLSIAIAALFVYRGVLIHQRDSARAGLAATQSQLADSHHFQDLCRDFAEYSASRTALFLVLHRLFQPSRL